MYWIQESSGFRWFILHRSKLWSMQFEINNQNLSMLSCLFEMDSTNWMHGQISGHLTICIKLGSLLWFNPHYQQKKAYTYARLTGQHLDPRVSHQLAQPCWAKAFLIAWQSRKTFSYNKEMWCWTHCVKSTHWGIISPPVWSFVMDILLSQQPTGSVKTIGCIDEIMLVSTDTDAEVIRSQI